MDELPEEIILRIFAYLDKKTLCLGVRPVCRQWLQIQKDASLWKTFFVPKHFTHERFKLMMADIGHRLEVLNCSKCEMFCFLVLDRNKRGFPNMKILYLPLDKVQTCGPDLPYMEYLCHIFPNLDALYNIQARYHSFICIDNLVDVLQCQSFFPHVREVTDNPKACYSDIQQHNEISLKQTRAVDEEYCSISGKEQRIDKL